MRQANQQSMLLRQMRFSVHDADATVHRLMGPNGAAVAAITACFGADIGDQATGINRNRLGNLVFTNPEKKAALEAILHPLVRQHKDQFIKRARRHRKSAVFLDVPLLFETGAIRLVILSLRSVPAFIQRQRALRRDGMTPEKLHAIVQAQYPQPDKKQMSDLALPSSLGRAETNRRLRKWLKSAKLL